MRATTDDNAYASASLVLNATVILPFNIGWVKFLGSAVYHPDDPKFNLTAAAEFPFFGDSIRIDTFFSFGAGRLSMEGSVQLASLGDITVWGFMEGNNFLRSKGLFPDADDDSDDALRSSLFSFYVEVLFTLLVHISPSRSKGQFVTP